MSGGNGHNHWNGEFCYDVCWHTHLATLINVLLSVCVFVRLHLAGHTCALDQTCEHVFVRTFFARTFFGSSEKSGCTAVFSVLQMHVSASFRHVLGSEHCSCSVSVCSTAHATTRTLDNLCVVRRHLGGHICTLDQTCEDVFSCEDFLGSLGNLDVFLSRAFSAPLKMYVCFCDYNSTQTCMCVCVSVCLSVCLCVCLSVCLSVCV